MLLASSASHGSNPSLYKKLGYDPVADFAPIARVVFYPSVLAVRKALPVKTVADLVAYAKANPGKLNYGSSGRGSSNHLATELLKRSAGVNLTHIPFQGGGPMDSALVAGQIQVGFDTLASMNLVKGGRLRVLAVSGKDRSKGLPDVPTIQESGVAGYDVTFWLGYFAPANTPRDVVNKISNTIREISAKPDTSERLAGFALERSNATPEQFTTQVRAEVDKWDRLLKSLGNAQ